VSGPSALRPTPYAPDHGRRAAGGEPAGPEPPRAACPLPPARSWGFLVYPGLAGGALYLYLRFYRGLKLTDLMYVTRSSLENMKKAMGESGWRRRQAGRPAAAGLAGLAGRQGEAQLPSALTVRAARARRRR
jgi:hypothetical protein